MERMLVTGGSGLLGANVVHASLAGFEVVAVCRNNTIHHPRVQTLAEDLSVPGSIRRIVSEIRPDIIVHCAATTDLDRCEREPDAAYRINHEMSAALAEAAAEHGAYLIHISTDAVFDGKTGGYDEQDAPSPISVYGKSKLLGEQAVLKAHPGATVVRTNFYGWNAQDKLSLGEWFLSRLRSGERVPGFSDVWFNPLLVNQLVDILLRIAADRTSGVLHVVGSDCITKYEFGRRLAEVFGLDPERLDPVSIEHVGLFAPRARRLCLASERVESLLGLAMPDVDSGLRQFRELEETGYVVMLKSMLGAQAKTA